MGWGVSVGVVIKSTKKEKPQELAWVLALLCLEGSMAGWLHAFFHALGAVTFGYVGIRPVIHCLMGILFVLYA